MKNSGRSCRAAVRAWQQKDCQIPANWDLDQEQETGGLASTGAIRTVAGQDSPGTLNDRTNTGTSCELTQLG